MEYNDSPNQEKSILHDSAIYSDTDMIKKLARGKLTSKNRQILESHIKEGLSGIESRQLVFRALGYLQ